MAISGRIECGICGQVNKAVPVQTQTGTVHLAICPRCDRRRCGTCQNYEQSPIATKCNTCGAYIGLK